MDKRRIAALCFLTVSIGSALWLPLRGTAQQPDNTPPSVPYPPSSADYPMSSPPQNSNPPSDNSANTSASSTTTSNGVNSNSGRTVISLRDLLKPAPPSNPLIIVDPVHRSGNPTADYNFNGRRNPVAVPSRAPENYTLPTDPLHDPLRPVQKRLPLFGYDFFAPARQIILARRRALLRPPVRAFYTPNQAPNGSNNRNVIGNQNFNPNLNQATPQISPNTQDQFLPGTQGYDNGNGSSGSDNAAQNRQSYPNNQYPADTGGQSNYGDQNANSAYGIAAAGSVAAASSNPNADINNPYTNQPYANSAGAGSQTFTPEQPGTASNPNSSNDQYLNPNQTLYPDQSVYPGQTDTANQPVPRRRRNTGNAAGDSNNNAYDYNNDGYITNGGGYDNNANSSPYGITDNSFNAGGAYDFGPSDYNSVNSMSGQIADPLATLNQNISASLPPNYQLQPGDSLTVRYSTLTVPSREATTVVDSQGGITVQGVGRIIVAGRTSAEAEDILRRRLERLYKGVDVSITLRQLRTIQVTVSGAAFAPGTYTVPAASTAFNVLNAAGGPTPDGSLRNIRVLRNGRLVGSLDLYPLLGASSEIAAAPGQTSDVNLQPRDIIYIPARFSRVAVRGEVRQPAIFELTPTEGLRDVLAYAGGVKPSGVDQLVHIDTFDRGTDRRILDVNLRNATQVAKAPIYDGDTVEISSVRTILVNRVTVEGAVDQPGDYALVPGMRVADLIQRARGPLYNAYYDRADLTRLNSDNTTTLYSVNVEKALTLDPDSDIPLARFDRLRLYTRSEVAFLGNRTVTVRGAVQRPGLYTRSDKEHVSDLLLAVGGPLPDAYLNRAVLLHQHSDGSFAYNYVNIGDALAGDTVQNVALQDNDILAVYRVGEAHFTPDHVVTIRGAVVAPGIYPRGDGMRLSDLLKLAGTFRPGGGSRVTIAHARRPLDQPAILVAANPSIIRVAFNGEGIPTEGADVLLQDGDVIAVQGDGSLREHPSVVTVSGAVNRPGPIILTGKERLSDAVRAAGGLRPEAFPQGAEFTRDANTLTTFNQINLANIINQMSNMLNLSEYQRERAKANLELIQAAGSAASGSSSGLAIPGVTPTSSNSANPNNAPLFSSLALNNLVSPGRILTFSQLQPNGSVAVRLADALRRPGSTADILLKDGDTLVVPETPTTIQIVGAVFNPRGVLWKSGQSINYYVQSAGDYTPDAARDRIEVIHAGGGLIPADKAGALQPGDLILIPTKVLAEKISRSGNSFSNVFQALAGSAITYKVLLSLIGK